MTPGPRGARTAGFTLVELLVALALLAVLATLLVRGLDLGLRTRASLQASGEASRDMAGAARTLRRLVESAAPGPAGGGPDSPVPFFGSDTRLTLQVEGGIGGPPLPHEVVLLVHEGRLEARQRPAGSSVAPQVVSLAAPVQGVGFAYLSEGTAGEPAGWRQEWREASTLPAMVRISLQGPGGKPWPALVVRPRRDRPVR